MHERRRLRPEPVGEAIGAQAGPVGGNGVCEGGENASSCSADCAGDPAPVCGNGSCEAGETASSCAADCGGGSTAQRGCATRAKCRAARSTALSVRMNAATRPAPQIAWIPRWRPASTPATATTSSGASSRAACRCAGTCARRFDGGRPRAVRGVRERRDGLLRRELLRLPLIRLRGGDAHGALRRAFYRGNRSGPGGAMVSLEQRSRPRGRACA